MQASWRNEVRGRVKRREDVAIGEWKVDEGCESAIGGGQERR